MLKNYFKSAIRNLLRNKIYSFINIAGLSLGLACAMLIILYVKDETSYDRFHANANNTYRIILKELGDGNTGYFHGPRLAKHIPEIKSFVRLQNHNTEFKTRDGLITSQRLLCTDSSFFSVFTFPLISGNPNTCLLQPYSIVLSEDEAKKQFGKADAMGKILLLRDNNTFMPYTVTAVAKRCPQNSSVKFDILLPIKISAAEETDDENWFNFGLNTFVVLNANASVSTVEKKIKQVYEAETKDEVKKLTAKMQQPPEFNIVLQPFTDIHLNKNLPGGNSMVDASNPVFSYILSGIALFILLIACINFVNLTVARSVKRAKEIGIRKVVGGDRKQLIIQFLGESFVLCFIAFLLAIIIVQFALPVFNNLSNKALALSYLFDIKLVSGYVALFIITGLLAGFYPALVLSAYNPVQTLYSRFTLAGKIYLQKSLVVFQFALASFLIIATLAIFKQFNFLTTEKLGYDDSNLITINKRNLTQSNAVLFKQQLMQNPNIIDVAVKNGGTLLANDPPFTFSVENIDEAYFPLLKIQVIEGRNFSKEFRSDSSSSIIVNESFVKAKAWKNPIGEIVTSNDKKYTVIGVIKDYHAESLSKKIIPQLFTMNPSNNYGMAFIKIKPNTEAASLQQLKKVFKNLFPQNSYSYKFKHDENLKSYEAEAKWKQIILFGAVLTIFISCIGLFGLSVLSAEKRKKEIGIRKVFGASVGSVVTILSKDFLTLVIVSLLISIPVAWIAINKWLANYPYRITITWTIFALPVVLVILVALATVSSQAIKAAVANPVKSLRSE